MGEGNPGEGGQGGKGAILKAWGRWLDNKADFLVSRRRGTRDTGARPGKLSSLGPGPRMKVSSPPHPYTQVSEGGQRSGRRPGRAHPL